MPVTAAASLLLVQRLQLGSDLQFVETLQSSVTTSWGVDWDETYIARDIMQNFFDANRDRLTSVRTTVDGPNVTISAPTAFHLKRLFYLGSEKADDDIGHYGEGFKAAATCLLRDHRVTPVAASGYDLVVLRIADDAVPGTNMFPVVYDFYRSATPFPQSILTLVGCSRRLADALERGLSHFFHEDNPVLGDLRWKSQDGHFSAYASQDGRGHVFYRKLRRGEFEGIPVVLVIDKEYAAIEKLIKKDRDRNAFGEAMLKVFFDTFARSGLSKESRAQRAVVELARPVWTRGHPLLSEIADSVRYRSGWTRSLADEVFGSGYYCRSTSDDRARQLEYDRLERQWKEEGKQCLPQYFSRFGVLNPKAHLEAIRDKAVEEAKRDAKRPPSPAEIAAIEVLTGVMRELSPEIVGIFQKRKTRYTVAETEALLGELRSGREYRSTEVFLAATVFVADFAQALAVFLHEHAHIFGYDGSRGFTDALTEMLETVVRCRENVGRYESLWDEARASVEAERRLVKPEVATFKDALRKKGEDDLRALLDRIPEAVLRKYCGEDTAIASSQGD